MGRMSRLLPLCSLLAGLLLARGAPAQEDRVVRDQWIEIFQGGRKLGWEHVRIVEHRSNPARGNRFEVFRDAWWPVADGVATRSMRAECDGSGNVRAVEVHASDRHGISDVRGTVERTGRFVLRSVLRGQPELAIEIQQPMSLDVLALLAARGSTGMRDRSLTTLDLRPAALGAVPHAARQAAIRFQREGDTLVVEDGQGDEATHRVFRTDGSLIRIDDPWVGVEALPCSEIEAADATRRREPPAGSPIDVEGVRSESLGVAIAWPAPGWAFSRTTGPGGECLLASHAEGAQLTVMPFPVAPPVDPRLRKHRFPSLVRDVARLTGADVGLPEPAGFGGRPAVRVSTSGMTAGIPFEGHAWVVAGPGGGLLVQAMAPADIRKGVRDLLGAACSAIALGEEGPPRPEEFEGAGVLLDLPSGWREMQNGAYQSPDRVVRVSAHGDPLGGLPAAAAEDRVIGEFTGVGAVTAEDEAVEFAGVACRRVALGLDPVPGASGWPMRTVLVFREDPGRLSYVVVVYFDAEGVEEIVQGVLATLRWSER